MSSREPHLQIEIDKVERWYNTWAKYRIKIPHTLHDLQWQDHPRIIEHGDKKETNDIRTKTHDHDLQVILLINKQSMSNPR